MKKLNYLLLSVLLLILSSCDPNSSELISEPDELIKNEKIDNSIKESNRTICIAEIDGPGCSRANNTVTLTADPDLTDLSWGIDNGDMSIIDGQGTHEVTVQTGPNFQGGVVKLSANNVEIVIVGGTLSSCWGFYQLRSCNPIVNGCPIYALGITDGYIDGTQSGSDIIYINVSSNAPSGTTYALQVKRQNGTIQFYPASTSTVRAIAASVSNPVVEITVTSEFTYNGKLCSQTATKTYNCTTANGPCPIPSF